MATQAIKVTLGPANSAGEYGASADSAAQSTASLAAAAEVAAVEAALAEVEETSEPATEAALAVLEADGASPTEAHVDDLRAAYDVLVADLATIRAEWDLLVTALAGVAVNPSGNVIVTYDDSVINTGNKFRAAMTAALQGARSRGLVIPG